jgi:hypothetical protein
LFGFLPWISRNITDYLLTGFISTEGVSQTQEVKSLRAPTAVGDLEEEPRRKRYQISDVSDQKRKKEPPAAAPELWRGKRFFTNGHEVFLGGIYWIFLWRFFGFCR